MSVSNKKKSYRKNVYNRKMARDCVEGANAIKRANTLYLPMPNGFNYLPDDRPAPQQPRDNETFSEYDAPWFHSNPAYSAFLQRARFPEIVSLALHGLVGTATRKDPEIKLPPAISYMEEDAGKNGESLCRVFATMIYECLIAGNCFPLLDVHQKTNKLFIDVIPAEEFVDWEESIYGDGLTFANIEINSTVRSKIDKFVSEEKTYNFVFSHAEDGAAVVVEKYCDGVIESPAEEITIQGKSFERIPLFPVGSVENCSKPQPALILGLCEIALDIYRTDADIKNARHLTCNPTMVITGAEDTSDPETGESSGGVPMLAGSQVALMLGDPNAKVFYPNTDTSALEHVGKTIQDFYVEATMYSSSIVSSAPSTKVEAFETVQLKEVAKNASLISVVNNVSEQMVRILQYAAELSGASPDAVEFTPYTDFADGRISKELLDSLVDIWKNRGLSLISLLEILKGANLLPKNKTVEQLITEINTEAPRVEQ